MMSRAIRRHHYRRLQKKRKSYWGGSFGTKTEVRYMHTEAYRLGVLVSTPHPCSCIGCGNKRRIEGPSMQERRAAISAKEQIMDLVV